MIRSPLIWLGQPDPVASMESSREDDPELADIRELFILWIDYLDLDEKLHGDQDHRDCLPAVIAQRLQSSPFKELLLRIAGDRQGTVVSSKRLGWWLRKISGRVVDGHRLETGRMNKALAYYWLSKV